jgi:hypothetical protein
LIPPPSTQVFEKYSFPQFIGFIMFHNTQIGIHTAQKFLLFLTASFLPQTCLLAGRLNRFFTLRTLRIKIEKESEINSD